MTDKKPVASCMPIYDAHERKLKRLVPPKEEQTDFEKVIIALYRLARYGEETEFEEERPFLYYDALQDLVLKTRETTIKCDEEKRDADFRKKVGGTYGAIVKKLRYYEYSKKEIDKHQRDLLVISEKIQTGDYDYKKIISNITDYLAQGKNLANTFNCLMNRPEENGTEEDLTETVDTETGEITDATTSDDIPIANTLDKQKAYIAEWISDRLELNPPSIEKITSWIDAYGYNDIMTAIVSVEWEKKEQGKPVEIKYIDNKLRLMATGISY